MNRSLPAPAVALVAAVLGVLCAQSAGAQGLGGFVSPGPLAQDHADLDSILKCTSCHDAGSGISPTKCMDCHERVQEQVQTGKGFHANFGDACHTCHSDHQGRDFALVTLVEETFNHQNTGFALTGKHQIECVACHKEAPEDYTGLSQACASCHDEPHGKGESTRELIANCRMCHDADDWTIDPLPVAVFDHNDPNQTDYALHEAHDDVTCTDCHKEAQFVPTAADVCTDCHEDIHGGQFGGTACTDCHADTVPDWRTVGFRHDRTDFALTGAHADVKCASCHGSGKQAHYRDLPADRCETCHEDVHAGQFAPRDCDACHSSDHGGFTEGVIDHDQTRFPLRNAHADPDVTCDDCHGEGPAATFADLPFADCDDCHQDIHEQRFEPDACIDCHQQDGLWDVDAFDHGRTKYFLEGAHADVLCTSCHGEAETKTLTGIAHEACADCHASDDPHDGSLGSLVCEDCHTEQEWAQLIAFDHSRTEWPLEGKHAATDVKCVDCHERTEEVVPLNTAPEACVDCHEKDEPRDHYDGSCDDCHTPNGWADASLSLEAHANTGFALRGVHAVVACDTCHAPSEPSATASGECIDCHAADDPHRGQLGGECADCHGEVDWMRTTFRHIQVGWPLRGPHRAAACEDCHAAGYVATPSDCGSCHAGDAPNDTLHNDPLTSTCDTCHRQYTWDDPNFVNGEIP